MNRKDLQGLSAIRLKEATALLELGLFDGAYYLAGYAVECALKACIAKTTQRQEFPDKKRVDASYTHSLLLLIRVAGLKEEIESRVAADRLFAKNWQVVQSWSEESRYRTHSFESARVLLEAIRDRRHGVLSCIKKRW